MCCGKRPAPHPVPSRGCFHESKSSKLNGGSKNQKFGIQKNCLRSNESIKTQRRACHRSAESPSHDAKMQRRFKLDTRKVASVPIAKVIEADTKIQRQTWSPGGQR